MLGLFMCAVPWRLFADLRQSFWQCDHMLHALAAASMVPLLCRLLAKSA